jgi:hypothetical protein
MPLGPQSAGRRFRRPSPPGRNYAHNRPCGPFSPTRIKGRVRLGEMKRLGEASLEKIEHRLRILKCRPPVVRLKAAYLRQRLSPSRAIPAGGVRRRSGKDLSNGPLEDCLFIQTLMCRDRDRERIARRKACGAARVISGRQNLQRVRASRYASGVPAL